MVRRTFLFGSMTNSERTVAVADISGWIMSYSVDTLRSASAMMGKPTTVCWVASMSLIQLACDSAGSTDSAIALTLRLSNSGLSLAVRPNSVVQTGVKSAGCENSTAHQSPAHSWKCLVPVEESCEKSGAVSHPADFTPVCTTELGLTAKLKPEFGKRNVKAIALSVDPAESHASWIKDIEATQHTVVAFPIIADADRKVSTLYDMIHPEMSATATVRSLFVIDPNKKVRLTITYPMSTGRNFDEVLRVIDALQLTDGYTVATPGNWKDGDDVIIPLSVQDPDVLKQKYPKGYKAERPYLRVTPQPNK